MRRTQYVGGHYRTSKNGNVHWVSGHSRNDYGSGCLWLFTAGLSAPFALALLTRVWS
jgi:hypothetical protein